MNKINDLKSGQGRIELQAKVINIGEVRSFEKLGNIGKVCNATIKDDSGTISLTLWNEQIDEISLGDEIKIINGYVSEFRDELQLSTGKFGKLEILKKSNDSNNTNNINSNTLKQNSFENNQNKETHNETSKEDDFDFLDIEEERI